MQKITMKQNKTPGILITFCGLDGCGKTTMINRLKNELGSKNVFVTKQPTDFVRNLEIFRNYQDSPEHTGYDYRSLSLIAASDRLQHTNHVILPQLRKGKIVISDRYIYSCIANLRARGYKTDKWIYEITSRILKPDIAFFFDLPVKAAVLRVRSRPEERDSYIDIKLQRRLRCEYKSICRNCDGVLIPTDISEDESFRLVKEYVKEAINNAKWRG